MAVALEMLGDDDGEELVEDEAGTIKDPYEAIESAIGMFIELTPDAGSCCCCCCCCW
jgi:hypothetical protein